MKFVLLLACGVIVGVSSAPTSDESQAEIKYYDNKMDEQGNYDFSFYTSNGIQRMENGVVKNVGLPDEYIVVTGEYSYIDADGNVVEVRYYADETGFHIIPSVSGPLLPPPAGSPVNPNIVASLLG